MIPDELKEYTKIARVLLQAVIELQHIEQANLKPEDFTTVSFKSVLSSLRHIESHATTAKEDMAVLAVLGGFVSRKETSELIGVHQATVARWVKNALSGQDAEAIKAGLRLSIHESESEAKSA